MSKRKSQPPSPAATIVTMLPIILKQVRAALFPQHPLGDFEDEPAEGGEANAQSFLQDTCALSRSLASNKLLRSNRRGKGVVPFTPVLEAHHSERRDVI